jgi:diguanylate cyclase (GGDEF)-like protein/PAS domain S-box-containing protein
MKIQANSLQARLTMLVVGIFLFGIWSLTLYLNRTLRDDMFDVIVEQQVTTASYIAKEIDQELRDRMIHLQNIAADLGRLGVEDVAAVGHYLESIKDLQYHFNAGTFVTGTDGVGRVSVPASIKRGGVDYSDRDYMLRSLRDGSTVIGAPVIGKVLKSPIFVITTPIRDRQGRINGVLAGVTDLAEPNFLDRMVRQSYGRTGYFLLGESKHRLIITSSDKQRVMTSWPPPGQIPLIDRHISGSEETGVTINPVGVEVLLTARRIPSAGWFLVAGFPTGEAFAPIRAMQYRVIMATTLLTLLLGCLAWWGLRRQLRPVEAAVRALKALPAAGNRIPALPVSNNDEIGTLIAAFNGLLETLRKREDRLKLGEGKLSTILDNVDAFIYLKDLDGRYIYVNRRMLTLFGVEEDEVIGKGDETFFDAVTAAQVRANDRRVLVDGETLRIEETNVTRKERIRTTYWSIKLPLRSENGAIYALCGISTDITARKQLEDQIREMAFHDTLTRLPNRRLLQDRMQQAIAASRRTDRYCALLYLDLDNFKPLNDAYGHGAGDMLLIEVAHRLRRCVRETDTVARVGGDEFVVMLGELDEEAPVSQAQALDVARKVIESLSQPYQLTLKHRGIEQQIVHRCTASIGMALFVGDSADIDAVLMSADKAMYDAKEAGGNVIRFAPAAAP